MTAVWGASRLLFSREEVGILLNLSPRQITRLIHNPTRPAMTGDFCAYWGQPSLRREHLTKE